MTNSYLLGLATLPTLAAVGWVAWWLWRNAHILLQRFVIAVVPDRQTSRIDFGALAASSRKVWLIDLSGTGKGITFAVTAGVNHVLYPKCREALRPVLLKTAKVVSPGIVPEGDQ